MCILITFGAMAIVGLCMYIGFSIAEEMEIKIHKDTIKRIKEMRDNTHSCKYHKDNYIIQCHDKKGYEDCFNCPYIPFDELIKYI